MKRNIIAIGGGDIRQQQTLAIDKEIVQFSGKKQPTLLFIPTASSDKVSYCDEIRELFSDLGCLVDVLYLIKERPSTSIIEQKILSADIIYVGGGNTLKMMTLWRRLGIDILLNQARAQGAILCGVSAGSICWFNYGNSDSRKDKNLDADYIKVTGLGFIDAFHCPHHDTEHERKASLKKMMQKCSGIAIALDDCVALQIVDDTYRIISSREKASAYKIYWKLDKFYKEKIEAITNFKPLHELLRK